MPFRVPTPSELHRRLEKIADIADAEERETLISDVLKSNDLSVIRRIPILALPLQENEMEMIHKWSLQTLAEGNILTTKIDFAFHLMVNCEIATGKILDALEQKGTTSRKVLEKIAKIVDGEERTRYENYLSSVAEQLISNKYDANLRDRGRHMCMQLAKTNTDWQEIAQELVAKWDDMRQNVVQMFLNRCPDDDVLKTFGDNLTERCWKKILTAEKGHDAATEMHWIISYYERTQERSALEEALDCFLREHSDTVPSSVIKRLEPYGNFTHGIPAPE